jgi:DNA primase
MNSPATVLFDKSIALRLRQARESIVKANRAVVVEGYTDVMLAISMGLMVVAAWERADISACQGIAPLCGGLYGL